MNHHVLVRLGARFVAAAATRERRVLIDLGPYPALLPLEAPAPKLSIVHGELWTLDPARLPELDAFEGAPDLFRRERLDVVTGEEGQVVSASAYVLAARPPDRARVLRSGRYGASDA